MRTHLNSPNGRLSLLNDRRPGESATRSGRKHSLHYLLYETCHCCKMGQDYQLQCRHICMLCRSAVQYRNETATCHRHKKVLEHQAGVGFARSAGMPVVIVLQL